MGGAGYNPARVISATAEGCHFLCSCKESNQRNTPPGREPTCCARRYPALLGPSRDGAGTRCAQTPAPLRPRRTCGARLAQGGPNVKGKSCPPVDPRHAWMLLLLILTFQSALSEPSIAGESGAKRRRCLSAASSAPSPDSPRSTGNRRVATARGWRSVSLVTFFARKESDTPPRSRKRLSVRANENGTLAGAVSMNRFTRNLRTSRRTPPRSQRSPAPSATTRPPSGCRPRSGGSPDHGCPCGPASRP